MGRTRRVFVTAVAIVVAGAPNALAQADSLDGGRVEPIAGTGTVGFAGDGGPATAAVFNTPGALATDAAGDIYVADTFNQRIRRIDPSGTITTLAHLGMAFYPSAVAPDGQGNTYLTDYSEGGPRGGLRVIDGGGSLMTSSIDAQLTAPSAVATDAHGAVYIGDRTSVRRLDGTTLATGLTATAALAVDASGAVYVADEASVRRIDPAGTVTVVAGTGTQGFSGDGGPAVSAQLNRPTALAVDPDGTLYVADTDNQRVRAVTTAGTILTIAGTGKQAFNGSTGSARQTNLALPGGLAIAQDGHLLIADSYHGTVLRFSRGTGAGGCTRDAARQIFERRHVGNAGAMSDPVFQLLCGAFTGRRSKAMIASAAIPSCGGSAEWFVFRSVGGAWKQALRVRHGAFLDTSGSRIREFQGVLAAGDAHCFPSSYRARVWHWNGRRLVHGAWRRAKLPRRLPGLSS
jgi:sugar lactone lactonase YvrE